MKRFGIFMLYDADGVVDDFLFYLLESFRSSLDDLVIVSNGFIQSSYYERLSGYTSKIYLREDKGFDGGAYKDVVEKYCAEEDWCAWDEVILFNDTFYGPFFKWDVLFDEMQKKKVDFWGLNKNRIQFLSGENVEYISSYFVCFEKPILRSGYFKEYWKHVGYVEEYGDRNDFEFTMTDYFLDKGFQYATWYNHQQDIDEPTIHQFARPYEMLKDHRFPVLKYRSISIFFYKQAKAAIDYIKDNTDYNVNLIYKHIRRLAEKGKLASYTEEDLEKFVEKYKNIYFYGHGMFANGLKDYFNEKHWDIEGYLVTKAANEDEIEIDDYIFHEEDGIIVAVGASNVKAVNNRLKAIKNEHILTYSYRSTE